MLAELTPDHEGHSPSPGAPTSHTDIPHTPAEEQGGIQAAHMEGRALTVGSLGQPSPQSPITATWCCVKYLFILQKGSDCKCWRETRIAFLWDHPWDLHHPA